MVLSADLINLLLYCVQQFGITFGVGAETIVLMAYLMSIRDGVIDESEERFGRAVRRVLDVGLLLVILSGAGIALMHLLAGEAATILEPAFLFKWVLVGVILVATMVIQNRLLSPGWGEALAGGTWYAMFVLHILAPVTTWGLLLEIYVLWLAGFAVCWGALVLMLRGRPSKMSAPPPAKTSPAPTPQVASTNIQQPPPPPVQKPAPVTPPPAPPPPPAPKPAPVFATKEAAPPATVPAVTHVEIPAKSDIHDPDESPELPAVRVMPRTEADLKDQNRASVVQFP